MLHYIRGDNYIIVAGYSILLLHDNGMLQSIEHLHTNTKLAHLDLSENSISHISDISYLRSLKVRHLFRLIYFYVKLLCDDKCFINSSLYLMSLQLMCMSFVFL